MGSSSIEGRRKVVNEVKEFLEMTIKAAIAGQESCGNYNYAWATLRDIEEKSRELLEKLEADL